MKRNRDILQYWNEAHETQDLDRLTGNTLATHLEGLGLDPLFSFRHKDVLCIGVGNGEWIRELWTKGSRVRAVDISGVALARMSEFVWTEYLPHELPLLPSNCFQLVMSFWVSPHMGDEDLVDQISKVLPSLKPMGLFALHYNSPKYGREETSCSRPSPIRMGAGDLLRSKETMARLIEEAGGRPIRWGTVWDVPVHSLEMNYVWIRRKKS